MRHKHSDDPAWNVASIRAICERIVRLGFMPIAPQLSLPQFLDEATQRELAMRMCLAMLRDCDVLWAFGPDSDGVRQEIAHARVMGIQVVFQPDGGPHV